MLHSKSTFLFTESTVSSDTSISNILWDVINFGLPKDTLEAFTCQDIAIFTLSNLVVIALNVGLFVYDFTMRPPHIFL